MRDRSEKVLAGSDGAGGMMALTDLIPDCEAKRQTHVPFIGTDRVMWFCFGDYEATKSRSFRCRWCPVKDDCINKDTSRIQWSPIIFRVSKEVEQP